MVAALAYLAVSYTVIIHTDYEVIKVDSVFLDKYISISFFSFMEKLFVVNSKFIGNLFSRGI